MAYSTPEEISRFIQELAQGAKTRRRDGSPARPMLVLDLDGNVLRAFNTVSGQQLPLGLEDEGGRQFIPGDGNIAQLLKDGVIEESIKAAGTMDVRLPANLAQLLNRKTHQARTRDDFDHRLFDVCILTSRSMEDTLRLLKMSGVDYPESLTLVADSGANMYVNGSRAPLIDITAPELAFLEKVNTAPECLDSVRNAINEVLDLHNKDPLAPDEVGMEVKGAARNIHWRQVFLRRGEKENGPLDKAIGLAVKKALGDYVQKLSPRDDDGNPSFVVKAGPATAELIPARVTKAVGLTAILKAAKARGYNPSALVYAGDDVCKQNGQFIDRGTDYEAFAQGAQIAQTNGVPVFKTIHTHHPVHDDVNSSEPSSVKSAALAGITPDIITRLPGETAQLVCDIVRAVALGRHESAPRRGLA